MSGDIVRGAPPHAGSTAYINARIIDPVADKEYSGAILISDGKIADFGPSLFASGAPYGIASVDCGGLYLAPGLPWAASPRWCCCPTTSRRSTMPR